MDTAVAQRAFLFTDIEGSTRLWERNPAAMPRALAEHHRVIATAVERAGGRVFKTIGDAMCAEFPDGNDALRAAVDAQRGLECTDWRILGLDSPVRVRMAVHQGSVEEDAGELAGPVLNRISRLLAAGHGGQILVAGSAEVDASSAGVELRSLGERKLRDVPGTEHVLQVVAADLADTFPPINTLDPPQHNLPIEPNAFVGRETDLTRIRHYLLESGARLVTLLGPGGIGKTRLATQAGYDLLDSFADGVQIVELAGVRENELVSNSVMRTLGVREEPGMGARETLCNWLIGKSLLLILDNCEQVIDGVADLASAILRTAPKVKCLATSRVALEIRGEQRLPVEPLETPHMERSLEIARVAQNPAVQLFVDRATAVAPDFSLDTATAQPVAEICRRVDGIPLAIELAAARIATLSPVDLLVLLDRRLAALTGGARDLPNRHRTLHAAIGWSYQLLDDLERETFRKLSVFSGGWTLDAAESVLTARGVTALESLTAKSLVRTITGTDGSVRYAMLETIREFAADELGSDDEAFQTKSRHAAHFCAMSADASPSLLGDPDQQYWLKRIDIEYGNLSVVRQWLVETHDAQPLLKLCTDIWHYWALRGMSSQGIEWIRQALAEIDESDTVSRPIALRKLGNLLIDLGRLADARQCYEESLQLELRNQHPAGIAESLSNLGMVSVMLGDYAHYRSYLDQSVALWREVGNIRGEAIALHNLAVGLRDEGRDEEAEQCHLHVLELQHALQDTLGVGWTRHMLSKIALDRDDLDTAKLLAQEAVDIFQDGDDEQAAVRASEIIAAVDVRRGDLDIARTILSAALSLYEERLDVQGIAEANEGLALLEFQSGDTCAARAHLRTSQELRSQSGWVVPLVDRQKLLAVEAGIEESNSLSGSTLESGKLGKG